MIILIQDDRFIIEAFISLLTFSSQLQIKWEQKELQTRAIVIS
jgi:hypothetical protein